MLWIEKRRTGKSMFWAVAAMVGILGIALPAADAVGAGSLIGGTSIGDVEALARRGTAEPMALPVQNGCRASESVALHTGEFTWSLDDLVLPGRGPDLVLTHTYKSGGNIRGPWGRGWHLSLDLRVLPLENGNLLLVDGTGRKHEFVKRADEPGYDPPPGIHDVLTANEDDTFTRTLKNGTQHHFDADGKLTRIEDPNGNALAFEYQAEKTAVTGTSRFFVDLETGDLAHIARLTKITDAVGREVVFSYNDAGRLTEISGPGERRMSYTCDEGGNLVRITDPAGDFYAFTYDDRHRLLTVADPEGVVYIENTYDARERVETHNLNGKTFAFAYDAQNQTTTVTNPNGSKDQYEFTACCGNPTRIARDVDGLNLVTEYAYDEDMNLLSATDPKGNVAEYTYDGNGNMLTVAYPDGAETTYTYTADFNRVATLTDTLDRRTTFTYDDNGNLTQVRDAANNRKDFSYNAATGDLIAIDLGGPITQFAYNDHGYVSTITDPAGKDVALAYDALGNLTALTDRNGNTTTFGYDNKGRLVAVTDALENTTQFTYDKTGRLLERIDPLDHSAAFTYDDFGRLQQVIDGLNNPVALAYDDAGNLRSATDAEENATVYAYDAIGRLTEITDALENKVVYAYDPVGNLTSITDPRGNETVFAYDNRDRITRITYPDNTFETFEYSIVGNRVSMTDRKGNEKTFTYDNLNRMVKKTYEAGAEVAYTYNALGRLTSSDNGVHATEYVYDSLGRVAGVSQGNKNVQYTYDAVGNRIGATYPGQANVQYTYDALNRLKQIKTGTLIFADYTYDNAGRLTGAALADAVIQRAIDYDAADRMIRIANTVDGENRAKFEYTYNQAGDRTRKTVRDAAVHSYTYDAVSRLTQADYPGTSGFTDTIFAYDPAGNRSSVNAGAAAQYTANAMNQYSQVGGADFSWDANGNLINDGVNTYAYDVENRLTRFDSPDETIQYTYDDAGRLITRGDGTETVTYVYDFDRIIAEYNTDGELIQRYIYRPDTGELVAATKGFNQQHYYMTDAPGSVAEILDPAGALVERYAYDAYGNVAMTDANGDPLDASTIGNPFFFAGMPRDPTGLYVAGKRFYSPDLGRFIQAGPYNRSGNAYTYAGNDPVNGKTAADFAIPKAAAGLFNGRLDIASGDHAPTGMPWSDALVPNPNRANLCGQGSATRFPSLISGPAPLEGLRPATPAPSVRID